MNVVWGASDVNAELRAEYGDRVRPILVDGRKQDFSGMKARPSAASRADRGGRWAAVAALAHAWVGAADVTWRGRQCRGVDPSHGSGRWQSLADRSGIEASRKAVGRIVPTVTARPIPARADFVADGSPSFITRTGISIGLISISRCRSCASRTGGCGYTGWLTGKSP